MLCMYIPGSSSSADVSVFDRDSGDEMGEYSGAVMSELASESDRASESELASKSKLVVLQHTFQLLSLPWDVSFSSLRE